MKLCRIYILIAAFAIAFSAGASSSGEDAADPPALDNEVEELLDMHKIPNVTWSDMHERYAALLHALDNDPERVLEQILAYVREMPPGADIDARSWNGFYAIETLFVHHRGVLLERIVPLLESEDARTRSFVQSLLLHGSFDLAQHIHPVIERALRRHDEEVSYPLLTMLFERRPDAAFDVTLRHAREDRRAQGLDMHDFALDEAIRMVGLVDHVRWLFDRGVRPDPELLDRAREALRALSASDLWWARAYAAGVIGRDSRLRDAEAVWRLRGDDHPIVRDVASRLRER